MNRDIKKRKIRFWAFLLALVLMLPCAPITVEAAADYRSEEEGNRILNPNHLQKVEKLYPGDKFSLMTYDPGADRYIEYLQSDGSTSMKKYEDEDFSVGEHIVLNYSDMPDDKKEPGMNFAFGFLQ